MTFLEICRAAARACAIPGNGPANIATADGIERTIVDWVRDEWVNIQCLHSAWKFLHKTASFSTAPGQRSYTLTQLGATDLQFLISGRLKSLDGGEILLLSWAQFTGGLRHVLNDSGQPAVAAMQADGQALQVYPVPVAAHQFWFSYQPTPQLLANNNDVPIMPAHHHMLLVHAVEVRYAMFEKDVEQERTARSKYDALLQRLRNEQLPDLEF